MFGLGLELPSHTEHDSLPRAKYALLLIRRIQLGFARVWPAFQFRLRRLPYIIVKRGRLVSDGQRCRNRYRQSVSPRRNVVGVADNEL